MKYLIKTICTVFFLNAGFLFAQSSSIIGKWVNNYNSELAIMAYNPETGVFSGTYSSTTGASGKYSVFGFSPSGLRTDNSPIAFSIYWKSLDNGGDTPDQQWTSTMTGSFMTKKEGQIVMQVFHSLNASLPLESVEIDHAGRYSETLIFTPSSSRDIVGVKTSTKTTLDAENSLLGNWASDDGVILFDIKTVDSNGYLEGICSISDHTYLLGGYTTISPTGRYQSVSMNYIDKISNPNKCYSVSGFLDFQASDRFRLKVVIGEAKSVAISNNYSGVKISNASFTKAASDSNSTSKSSISYTVSKLPFTNNGSSEWIASIPIGSSSQSTNKPLLKFGMDTGGNFLWANSTQCKDNPCVNYGHVQFNPNSSPSFKWIDQTPKEIDWGPWGVGMANLGNDLFGLGTESSDVAYMKFDLITDFADTPQFQEFLWDGAIPFPSDSRQTAEGVSNFLKELVNTGYLSLDDNDRISISFAFDDASGKGTISIGSKYDIPIPIDESSKLVMAQKPSASVPYLWTTDMKQFQIGNKVQATTGLFSFDTGSSSLKGDSIKMVNALSDVIHYYDSSGVYPTIQYQMGIDVNDKTGLLSLTGGQYVKHIDQGQDAGTNQVQIQPLSGVPNLFVQGTTLLAHIYSVFWYQAVKQSSGEYELIGDEVWLYNYQDGPKIIIKSSSNALTDINEENFVIYPNPSLSDQLTVKFNIQEKSYVSIRISSIYSDKLTSSVVYKKDYGDFVDTGIQLLDIIPEKRLNKGIYVVELIKNPLKANKPSKVLKTKLIIK